MVKTLPLWKGLYPVKAAVIFFKGINCLIISVLLWCCVRWHSYWHRGIIKLNNHVNNRTISGPADPLLGDLQIHRLVRKNLKFMIALFIIAIAVFIYMIYVLIKPEKF